MSSSAWSPSSVGSGLVNPGSTGLCCFNCEVGMCSGQLSVGHLTSNASSMCGPGVGLLLPPTPTAFSHSSYSRLLLMGNR